MRTPWHRVLLLLLVLVTAGTLPGTVAGAPTGELPPALFLVITTKGDTIRARAVEPQPFDMMRVTTMAGEYSYLPASRIRGVLDESGADWTSEVLEQRRVVGRPLSNGVRAHRPPSSPSPYGPRSVTRSVAITETGAWGRIGGLEARERSYNVVFDLGRL